jgi:hypothetical protein
LKRGSGNAKKNIPFVVVVDDDDDDDNGYDDDVEPSGSNNRAFVC